MQNWSSNPAFVAYAITSLLLIVNLIFLWSYSGVVRGKTKIAINPEDSARFGAPLHELDPPAVARVLRAYDNAAASIYPFLILGLLYVLAGGSVGTGTVIFAVFTLARWLHTTMYLAAKQPWRTVFFILGNLATLALMVAVIRLLVRAA